MAQKTMYPAMSGSPNTTTTAAIGVSDTEISVAELSVLPAAPNICIIYVSSTKWERCLYSVKSNASGAGSITVARSGDGHASTDGSNGPLEFDSGAKVMRNYTAYDHDLVKDNIEDLETRKITSAGVTFENLNTNGDVGTGEDQVSAGNHTHSYQPLDGTLTALAGITTAADKLPYATGEDAFDVCDFTSLGRSLVGSTTESAVRNLIAATSSTTATQDIYVDKAATGDDTGVDWTNAFTTIQAAVNSLPVVINHAVTIIIRKGSTPYNENTTIQRAIAAGLITIRGEYYWHGVNTSSKTGKFDVGSSDFGYANRAQIAAGDQVWMTKWSGTVGSSTPVESIIDTVASVSGTEVTLTTNTAKALNTTWDYRIVKTQLSSNSDRTIALQNITGVTVIGLNISGKTRPVFTSNTKNVYVQYSYLSSVASHVVELVGQAGVMISQCCFSGSSDWCRGVYALETCYVSVIGSIFNLSGTGAFGLTYGQGCIGLINKCHIRSSVATGILSGTGSIAIMLNTLNEATTPLNPASNPGTDGSYII